MLMRTAIVAPPRIVAGSLPFLVKYPRETPVTANGHRYDRPSKGVPITRVIRIVATTEEPTPHLNP